MHTVIIYFTECVSVEYTGKKSKMQWLIETTPRRRSRTKKRGKKAFYFVANTQSDEMINVDKRLKNMTMIEKGENTCKSVRVISYSYIIIIAELVIQDHDLQRNSVVFLPRNRETETKSYKA